MLFRLTEEAFRLHSLSTKVQTIFFNFLFSIGPSGPPIDVKISDVTSSTMKVRWQPPSPSVRNGKITKYQVHFTGLGDTTIRQSREMTTNQTNARLTGLLPNTRYDVTVRAFTIVGPGPYSKAVDAFTKQGKVTVLTGFYFSYHVIQAC